MSVGIDDRMNLAGQPASWPNHWLSSVSSDTSTVLRDADKAAPTSWSN